MKKLEDIPKKQVFEVPEGYFDRLPGVIQTRIGKEKDTFEWSPVFRFGLRYALPVVAIVVAGLYFWPQPAESTEDLLASVDTSSLAAFIEESDISSDELLEDVSFTHGQVRSIEQNAMDEIMLNDQDAENLKDEFETDYF